MRRADILLLLSVTERARQTVYYARGFWPGKVFELFGAERPILCVPGDRAILEELITKTGTGVSIPEPDSIAMFLDKAFARWRRGEPQPYAPNVPEVSRYTRRAVTGQLAGLLDEVVEAQRAFSYGEERETCASSLGRKFERGRS